MREISSEEIKIGEHVIIDGVEYVAEKPNGEVVCDKCALHEFSHCVLIPCDCENLIFKRVEKEPQYRPYKDTEEMIEDYKERFNVSNVPPFCLPLIWVKGKPNFLTTEGTHLIVEIFEHVVRLGNSIITVQNLFDNYTYLDESPCGKVKE